jgi:nitroreductase
MCRHFRSDPLDPPVVDRLISLAERAPAAGRTKGRSWLVLAEAGERERFWAATGDPQRVPAGVAPAPVVVVPLCSRAAYEERYRRPDKRPIPWDVAYWTVDCAFATMLLLLGAEDAGLGALFFRLHRPPEGLRRQFGVPDEWDPIGAVALGWPAGPPASLTAGPPASLTAGPPASLTAGPPASLTAGPPARPPAERPTRRRRSADIHRGAW